MAKSKKSQPEQVKLTLKEAEALKARVSAATSVLTPQDIKILTGLITFNLWLQNQLAYAKLTIQRLKSFFGISTEKKTPEILKATTTVKKPTT